MPYFRKKPVTVEARQFTLLFDVYELLQWINEGQEDVWLPPASLFDGKLTIPTLEGDMVAFPGDWIIRGVAGEHYPCKPDIFDETYEPFA